MTRIHVALGLSTLLTLAALGLALSGYAETRRQAEEIARLREEHEDRQTSPTLAPRPPATPLPPADLGGGSGGGPGAGGVSMADVAARVLPAVVNITTLARQGQGAGSGVVVDREGLVVTNAHVVAGAMRVVVNLSDGREFPAEIVGADPQTDIALLRIRAPNGAPELTPLPYGDSSRLRQGDVVLAIGNPFGVGQTVTMGIVSATGRAEMRIAEYEDFIQTDAAINPGNSGGALVSMEGELVGINAAILSRTGGSHGIGFAIPTNMVRPIVASLLRHGKVVRGWLGVTIQDVTPELATALQLASSRGVIVTGMEPGSPAEGAGLQRGDVIEQIEGERMLSSAQLRTMVATRGPTAAVRMTVLRGGERREIDVTLGERPQVPITQQAPPSARPQPQPQPADPRYGLPLPPGLIPGLPPGWGGGPPEPPPPLPEPRAVDVGGLAVIDLDARVRERAQISPDVRSGAVIVDVRRGSPGDIAGLQPGDVIVEVNRTPISGVAQLQHEYARAGGNAVLLVRRGAGTLYVVIR
jgi:serine protease Do